MSALLYGALTRKREEAPAGASTEAKPPGLKTYVDALAALVPAEVLALHALVIGRATKTDNGPTSITAAPQLIFFFWFLVILSAALYVVGLRTIPLGWNLVRMTIPPLAFLGWTMLQPTTVAPHFAADWRWAIGLALAAGLALVAAALGGVADRKPPPVPVPHRPATPPT
jgi:hypothetical protein